MEKFVLMVFKNVELTMIEEDLSRVVVLFSPLIECNFVPTRDMSALEVVFCISCDYPDESLVISSEQVYFLLESLDKSISNVYDFVEVKNGNTDFNLD